MTPEETKEFIDNNFDEIVNRYIDAVVERGKETKGPEFKLTNDLREKVNDFVNETIEIFKDNLGDAGQVSVEDFIEFVNDRFEAAGSPDVIDTLLDEYKEDDDIAGYFDAVKKPQLDAAEDAEDTEDGTEFRKKVYDAIELISGPFSDKYLDLLVDLSRRAIENFNGDVYDAAATALDEGLIYKEDNWTIMEYWQDPENANLSEAIGSTTDDIVKVLNAEFSKDEDAEDQNPLITL